MPMALRNILRRRAISVAFGVEADIGSLAEFDDLSKMDPQRTFGPSPRTARYDLISRTAIGANFCRASRWNDD